MGQINERGVRQASGLNGTFNDNQPIDALVDPTDLDNLEFWYRADLGKTVDSTRVTDWDDQSGNAGRDLAAGGNTATHPVESTIDGIDAILFDGVNDALQNAAFTTGISQGDMTFVMVVRDNSGGATANQNVVAWSGAFHLFS